MKARGSATIENRTHNSDGVQRSAGPTCPKHIRANSDSNRFTVTRKHHLTTVEHHFQNPW